MRSSLAIQLGQQINITPQLLQSIRLLQLNSIELEAHVRDALESNPMLESSENDTEDTDQTPEKTTAQDSPQETITYDARDTTSTDYAFQSSGGNSYDDDDDDDYLESRFAAPTPDIRQHILQQLVLMLHDPNEIKACEWLVDQIDDNGYLERDPESLGELLPQEIAVRPKRLEAIRQLMMRLEPTGYGARDLRECLIVQLGELPPEIQGRQLALRIVMNHLNQLATQEQNILIELLNTDTTEFMHAERLILSLDPRPGHALTSTTAGYITPDVIVDVDLKGWQIRLNHVVTPYIRVNQVYENMLNRNDNSTGARDLRQLLQEARWLTRALAMRHETLIKVSKAIVERQRGFLELGAEAMQPLTLREVADVIGMHESTVSRITTGKYMQTPRGTFELKYFFSGRLQGAEVSGLAIRAMVKRLIDGESPTEPLADEMIATLLARQGVRIARRTVAKYRELLHIASAKERRRVSGKAIASLS